MNNNNSTQFAVLHITKYKKLKGIGRHIDRKYSPHNANPEKTHLNEELVGKKKTLPKAVEARIQQGYKLKKAIRKDAVKAIGIILSGSHQQMKNIEANPELFKAWKNKNYDFVCKEFGKENIVRFSIHRDEQTPHVHCVVVPITKDGRLAAADFTDGADMLQGYQNRYAKAMVEFKLSRGISKNITQKRHLTTSDYYLSLNLDNLLKKGEPFIKMNSKATETTQPLVKSPKTVPLKNNGGKI